MTDVMTLPGIDPDDLEDLDAELSQTDDIGTKPSDVRSWVRLATDLPQNRKVWQTSNRPLAIAAAVTAICRSAEMGLDGFFEMTFVKALLGDALTDAFINEMTSTGLWHISGHDCEDCPDVPAHQGYSHDFLKHQRSQAQIIKESQNHQEWGRKGAEERWRKENAKKERRQKAIKEAEKLDPALEAKVAELCSHLADAIRDMDPDKSRRPQINQTWREHAKIMLVEHGRDLEKVKQLIDWMVRTGPHPKNYWHGKLKTMRQFAEKYTGIHSDAVAYWNMEKDRRKRPGARGPANDLTPTPAQDGALFGAPGAQAAEHTYLDDINPGDRDL